MSVRLVPYSLGEEIFNGVTHGVGALLSVAGCVLMIIKAALNGSAIDVVSASIFGASLIILYSMSTLYHCITNKKAKLVLRVFDHCTIYLLICGTYTPYTLEAIGGAPGWTLFGIIWGMGILGIVLNAVNLERFKKISLVSYILMGWCIIVAIKPLVTALGTGGTVFLLTGGIAYTGGLIFYRLNRIKYMHSIWHIFVVAGSILHFFSILFYVIP